MRTASLALVVALVAGVADARVVMPPGIQRSCHGPSTWDELAKCVKPYADAPLPARPTSIVTLIRDRQRFRRWVFTQRSDGKWQLQASLPSGEFEIVGHRKVKAGPMVYERIDLFGHDNNQTATLHRKIALFCNDDGCNELTYACTALFRGRAVETFAGDIQISREGALSVVGDHSQSGSLCP